MCHLLNGGSLSWNTLYPKELRAVGGWVAYVCYNWKCIHFRATWWSLGLVMTRNKSSTHAPPGDRQSKFLWTYCCSRSGSTISSGKKLLTKLDSFRQVWVRGATDNASAYGAEDCRFESCRTLKTFFLFFSFTFFSNCFFNAINCSRSSSCCCCNLFLVYSNSLRTLSYFCL